jgi:Family of unknown function (DUF6428)
MKLQELKQLLQRHPNKGFRLQLPTGDPVPVSFHITEVGHVRKKFLDCGGRMHETETCQLQAWVGSDEEHRLANGKLLGILDKAAAFLPGDQLPVEIEYEDTALSQHPIAGADVRGDAVVLRLEAKHTDCLAKDVCLPPEKSAVGCGCAPTGCCG